MAKMTAPGGWQVEPIVIERGGRTLRLYRVSRHRVFVGECGTPAEVAAVGVPMAELTEEKISGVRARSSFLR